MSKFKIPRIPGYTKVQVISFLKMRLKTDDAWVKRACVVIHERQTTEERLAHLSVAGHNGQGFSRNDAPLLSHIACRIKQNRESEADVKALHLYMPKYAGQLVWAAIRYDNVTNLTEHLKKYYPQQHLPF